MQVSRSFAILICAVFCFLKTSGDPIPPIVRLGIDKGLSNNSVRCIFQDKKGFIWIGTYDGLNRYDGNEFKIYRNRPNDSTSLPHNYIFSIFEDKDNHLWVATGQGLTILDRTLSKFIPVSCYRAPGNQLQRLTISTSVITAGPDGNVLIGTNGWGMFTIKAGEKIAKQVYCEIGGKKTDAYFVNSIVVAENKTWVFIAEKGLCLYDSRTNSITTVEATIKSATCMATDGHDNIWVGSESGLYAFSMAAKSYTVHYSQSNGTIPFDMISSLHYQNKGELWVGTEGEGIAVLNIASGKFRYLRPGKGTADLSSEAVYSINSDSEGRIWIGTHKGGCNIIDESPGRFTTISNDPFNRNSLVSNFVYSFSESKTDGDIIIGTDGGGLSIWNRGTNSFRNYTHQPGNSSSLSHNSVTSIFIDHTGSAWISTLGGGVNRFNEATGRFEHFRCINDSTGLENKSALTVFEDRGQALWATTFGKLYRFNRTVNHFEVFSQEINDPISIFEDKGGTLWAGNASQLIKIDRTGGQHVFYNIGKPVRAILEDSGGRFWIGTEGGGLVLFNRVQGEIVKRFTDANGLSNNAVLNIMEDGKGNLWMSTFNGLSRFDPVQNQFSNFFQSDGLQSNQFSYRAAYKLQSGEMLFGGINGFSIFHPDSIASRNYMPPLYITGVQINNRDFAETGKEYITARSNDEVLGLEIPYHETILSIRFNALEFSSPEKISYAYFLEGWDRDWTYPGNTRTINYNNLHEGHYTLHLKSTNAAGAWNPQETVLKLVVLPPWYRSWWAYSLYVLLTFLIGALIYNYRVQQERLRYKVKLTQMNAEKEKEINEKRQSFFNNITHEFRAPLTMIINPLKDLLNTDEGGNNKEELSFVYRNARRLLSLVDQLLLVRKTETDTGQLVIANHNFYQLCHETWLYFVQQAKSRNIKYLFECENTELAIVGDKEKLEIVLFNLISNALKFTPEGGTVSLSVKENEDSVELWVSDTGPGIPANVGDKLFEKYYRVKNDSTSSKPGFGIGLYLANLFVQMHFGSLHYESKPGEGACFTFSLKKGATHFGNTEVLEGAKDSTPIMDEIAAGNEFVPQSKKKTDGLESIVTEQRSMLITDDNPQMRSYLAQVFQKDFRVYEAGSGAEGLKIARQVQPDIIISDVVMEDMSGVDFCKAVKEAPVLNHIPFILITGSFSPESKMQGIEFGADDYITKPFEKDMLVARVQSLLRNQQNLQKYFYNEITHQQNYLNVSGEYKQFLEACIEIVEKHLDEDNFNIQVLATEIGMSHSKLYKIIKTISGQSANSFIRFIRLRKAAEMFINTNYNINQTAFYVGIKDIKYFREQFTKTFGMKPSEYIEKYRKSLGKNYRLNEKVTKERGE